MPCLENRRVTSCHVGEHYFTKSKAITPSTDGVTDYPYAGLDLDIIAIHPSAFHPFPFVEVNTMSQPLSLMGTPAVPYSDSKYYLNGSLVTGNVVSSSAWDPGNTNVYINYAPTVMTSIDSDNQMAASICHPGGYPNCPLALDPTNISGGTFAGVDSSIYQNNSFMAKIWLYCNSLQKTGLIREWNKLYRYTKECKSSRYLGAGIKVWTETGGASYDGMMYGGCLNPQTTYTMGVQVLAQNPPHPFGPGGTSYSGDLPNTAGVGNVCPSFGCGVPNCLSTPYATLPMLQTQLTGLVQAIEEEGIYGTMLSGELGMTARWAAQSKAEFSKSGINPFYAFETPPTSWPSLFPYAQGGWPVVTETTRGVVYMGTQRCLVGNAMSAGGTSYVTLHTWRLYLWLDHPDPTYTNMCILVGRQDFQTQWLKPTGSNSRRAPATPFDFEIRCSWMIDASNSRFVNTGNPFYYLTQGSTPVDISCLYDCPADLAYIPVITANMIAVAMPLTIKYCWNTDLEVQTDTILPWRQCQFDINIDAAIFMLMDASVFPVIVKGHSFFKSLQAWGAKIQKGAAKVAGAATKVAGALETVGAFAALL